MEHVFSKYPTKTSPGGLRDAINNFLSSNFPPSIGFMFGLKGLCSLNVLCQPLLHNGMGHYGIGIPREAFKNKNR